MRFGVDFGTTHTVVAYADRGNYPVLSFADEAGDFHEWFPSIVAESAGRLRFGFDALALAEAEGEACSLVRSFKRWLGDLHAIPSTPVRVGALSVPLGDLVRGFLSALRHAILSASNLPAELKASAERELEAVVAVPAHAHGAQRFATLDAFRRAGFTPVGMLNEPSAAGFEFAHRHRSALSARRDHVVVYDLGGGTFDASLVRMRGKHHEVLGTAGLGQLGGDDFDRVLLECVRQSAGLTERELDERAFARLLEQCCEAKERLSPSSRKLAIDLEAALGTGQTPAQASIPVDTFYEACTPLVERTIETMLPVMASFEGVLALAEQASAGSSLAGIYVVGGASALPLVPRQLRKHFGRRVHKSPYPSAAVAIGLAIAADDDAGFELADRYAHTFGVFREGAEGLQITFDPIFTRESNVPARSGHALSFRRSYRAAHNVGHFRFLECSAVSSDGRPCGDVVPSGDVFFPFDASLREAAVDLAAVPVERTSGRGPHIEEEYTLDEHGMVAVTIRNIDADYQRVYRIGGLERRTG